MCQNLGYKPLIQSKDRYQRRTIQPERLRLVLGAKEKAMLDCLNWSQL
jgi:hypothetical protein